MSGPAKVVRLTPRPRRRRTPGPEEEALRQRLSELERELAAARTAEEHEGLLVKVQDLVINTHDDPVFVANRNYKTANCFDDSLEMFVDNDTDIPGNAITSSHLEVVGIAGQFDSSPPYTWWYQVQPRAMTDITFLSMVSVPAPDAAGDARLWPCVPSPAYPLPGLICLMVMAAAQGVVRGPQDLADYAETLSSAQLRALKLRTDPHTGDLRCPGKTTFTRVLHAVDDDQVERALLRWQDQILGPRQDRIVIVDGKKVRHAGVEIVNAVDSQGRFLGSVVTPAKTNEIPAARQLLRGQELQGKINPGEIDVFELLA